MLCSKLVVLSVPIVLCVTVLCCAVEAEKDSESGFFGFDAVERTILECVSGNESLPCFSEKAANLLENFMTQNFSLIDGLDLTRNKEKINYRESRSLKGFSRLEAAVSNFFKSHVISIDLSESQAMKIKRTGRGRAGSGEGGGGGGGGGGLFEYDKKEMKKEQKYMRYAFMVLLGIFGLTGPIVMKVLAIMAAQALIASKAALIIVGSVALKKIFQNEHHEKSSVKVHTISGHEDDEHDRTGNPYYGYATQYYNTPYSGYSAYEGYSSAYDAKDNKMKVTTR